jgi:hypothetical protein
VVAGSGCLQENVARAEGSRGRDGTLVVAMGSDEVPDSLVGRTILRMPQETAEAFREAERREIFAAVIDDAVAAATGELARELLLVGDPMGDLAGSAGEGPGEDTNANANANAEANAKTNAEANDESGLA